MAKEIVARIDQDPLRQDLAKARATCRRWYERNPQATVREWLEILEHPWEQIRALLLEDSERGQCLRQSDPFTGILIPQERWAIY